MNNLELVPTIRPNDFRPSLPVLYCCPSLSHRFWCCRQMPGDVAAVVADEAVAVDIPAEVQRARGAFRLVEGRRKASGAQASKVEAVTRRTGEAVPARTRLSANKPSKALPARTRLSANKPNKALPARIKLSANKPNKTNSRTARIMARTRSRTVRIMGRTRSKTASRTVQAGMEDTSRQWWLWHWARPASRLSAGR
jgi:hypothetical protein